ncbi:unnamed protein product [Protopolystoma xenopodis]|uniref:Uncharacterized protein n=1 Tax=Protopolystoma xenopodis TaxID=117903 RepID=A0A448XEP2_9PLAT|nr:unnamed protein product [Protopolystoma xenopodis]
MGRRFNQQSRNLPVPPGLFHDKVFLSQTLGSNIFTSDSIPSLSYEFALNPLLLLLISLGCRECDKRLRNVTECVANKFLERKLIGRRKVNNEKCVNFLVWEKRSEVACKAKEVKTHCNQKTGIAQTTTSWYTVENCKCRKHVLKMEKRCKCREEPQKVRTSRCTGCLRVHLLRSETLTPEGTCRVVFIRESEVCCCPLRHSLAPICDREKGLLRLGTRNYRWSSGKCLKHDHLWQKMIVCPRQEKTIYRREPNGWLRRVMEFTSRIGCKCVRRRQLDMFTFNWPVGAAGNVGPVLSYSCCLQIDKDFRIMMVQHLRCPLAFLFMGKLS